MAVCELSGQMLVYQDDKYQDIQEFEIISAMTESTLSTYNSVYADVQKLFSTN